MTDSFGRWQATGAGSYIPGRMNRILLYHDFASPFSRLAVAVTVAAAARTAMEVRAVPLELYPAPAPLPGPEELGDELEAARVVAEEWGLELGTLARVPRTRKAHEAVAYGRAQGREVPVLEALYDALWREGRDVSRLDVLAEAGAGAGLEREAMHVALGLDHFQDEVVREQEAAAAAGLDGVPAVQVGEVVAVGLLPEDELVEWIETNR